MDGLGRERDLAQDLLSFFRIYGEKFTILQNDGTCTKGMPDLPGLIGSLVAIELDDDALDDNRLERCELAGLARHSGARVIIVGYRCRPARENRRNEQGDSKRRYRHLNSR